MLVGRGATSYGLLLGIGEELEEPILVQDFLQYQPALGQATAIGASPIIISIRSLSLDTPDPELPYYVDARLPPRIASVDLEQEEPELESPRQGVVAKPGPRIAAVVKQTPSPTTTPTILGVARRISPRISSVKKGGESNN
jgi:hypothetical protein